jgi:hypothetical protein
MQIRIRARLLYPDKLIKYLGHLRDHHSPTFSEQAMCGRQEFYKLCALLLSKKVELQPLSLSFSMAGVNGSLEVLCLIV